MNKNYKCVLFDLDGTIIDSGPDLIDSLNYALQLENFNHIDKNILGSLVGGGAKVMIEKALRHLNEEVNENKLESMISSFLEFYLKIVQSSQNFMEMLFPHCKLLNQNLELVFALTKNNTLLRKY